METTTNENRVCVVCGENKPLAKYDHYGVKWCSSCAAFCRRTVIKEKTKIRPCSNNGPCVNLLMCMHCRFKKCKTVGLAEYYVAYKYQYQSNQARCSRNTSKRKHSTETSDAIGRKRNTPSSETPSTTIIEENLHKLQEWTDGVDVGLANQDFVSEDIRQLEAQLTDLKRIDHEVDEHVQPIKLCIAEVKQTAGSNVSKLRKDKFRLEESFELSKCVKRLLRHLKPAHDKLIEFNDQVLQLSSRLEKTRDRLEETFRSGNNEDDDEYVDELEQHDLDIHRAEETAIVFADQRTQYLRVINNCRKSLGLSKKLPISERTSSMRAEIAHVKANYESLLSRASQLESSWRNFNKLFSKTTNWLESMEKRVLQHLNFLDVDEIYRHVREFGVMREEHRARITDLDKLKDLGILYDSVVRDDHSTCDAEQASPDDRSELSQVEQQVAKISERYRLLGPRLESMFEFRKELREYHQNITMLSQFVAELKEQLAEDVTPTTRDDADAARDKLTRIINEYRNKNLLLADLKSQISKLEGTSGVHDLKHLRQNIKNDFRKLLETRKKREQDLEVICDKNGWINISID